MLGQVLLLQQGRKLVVETAESGSVTSSQPGVFKYQWAALFTTVGVANGDPSATASWAAFGSFLNAGIAGVRDVDAETGKLLWKFEFGGSPYQSTYMTPLIDVLLVLLVIFIVTAPLLTQAASTSISASRWRRPGRARRTAARRWAARPTWRRSTHR